MHVQRSICVVLGVLLTACGGAAAPGEAQYRITSGDERLVTTRDEPPTSDVTGDHAAASPRPVRLPPEIEESALARGAVPQEEEAEAEEPTVCPTDVPTLEVTTTDLLDGAALVLTAETTEARTMLRERMQRFAAMEERDRALQRAIELGRWDVPQEPTTVPSPREAVDEDDPMRPTRGVHIVMIPRGVRLELRQDDGAQSASAHELRRRVEDDAQALREGRCPLTFQPA